MKKCLRISCRFKVSKNFAETVKKKAKSLFLEGNIQILSPEEAEIIACGQKQSVDDLVDALYKIGESKKDFFIEIKAFEKRDVHRGIFRAIA